MAVVRKRQDDTNLKILRELVTSGGGNRQCFDCGQKGPTYVNMTIGSFVCTRCSGVLRGLTPPHRVKSISMATFTPDEIEFLKSHGNDFCAKTWLGLWDPKRIIHQDQRELMIDKYERKRYYLEPASPLKSLTNATKVSSLSSSNNSISNNQNNNSSNSIGITNNISNNKSSIITSTTSTITDNNFKNIALTPPSSLRITANGIVNSSSSSHSRQYRYNYQSDSNSNSTTNGGLMNGFNGIGSASISRQSGNKNASSSSSGNTTEINNSHHGFTPDSDFVADFSSANIFNATTTNSLMNGSKIHQNGVNNLQQKNFINGGTPNRVISGNTTTNATNLNENFADFDHAPIYNSAAAYQPSSCNNNINFATNCNYLPPISGITDYSQTVQSFSNNFDTIFNNNYNDIIAPNSSTNSSTTTANNNNSNNNNICNSSSLTSSNLNNLQWNVWQQFQWPPFPTCSTTTSTSTTSSEQQSQPIAQNQNRWSLPMSISTSNSMSSSATFNSNSSLNSTPPADRYAALKDLDEQIRESKAAAAAVDTFSNIHAQQPSSANPFKTNPPTQPQPIANPFQTNFSQATTATSGMFGSPTTHQQQQQQQTTNAFGSSTAFSVQPLPNFNGYTAQAALVTNGTNGCGLGFGAQQIVGSTNLKNPFAASSLNSNNPFL